NEAETIAATRAATKSKLGRAFDQDGPAWKKQAVKKALDDMAQKTTKDGKETTVGAAEADAAWKTNIDAQHGADAPGAKPAGGKTEAELPGYVKSVADTLSFATDYDAAYHAHKHAKELPTRPSPATEMAEYLKAARAFIRTTTGAFRANQNDSRSVVFEANGM